MTSGETGPSQPPSSQPPSSQPPKETLLTVAREWGRIGCLGFGGPPSHIVMLRDLSVHRRRWLTDSDFEDAVVACNLLPGPASTQLAIYCASRIRGRVGALVGGLAFILPGLAVVLSLSALFLANAPPRWIAGTGAGAGSAVAVVAVYAAAQLVPASWRRSTDRSRVRWIIYAAAGAVAAATAGGYLVLVLLFCGAVEIALRLKVGEASRVGLAMPLVKASVAATGGRAAVAWVAFKVGALAYGGGFVIVPLMRADAIGHHWMTAAQFLNAVAIGQVTPGPVTQTVAAVGFAAAGVGGGLLAATVAFTPSFVFILVGARRFDRLRANRTARLFLHGAGPAAIGAIFGAAIPLARSLAEPWQFAVLGAAALSLFVLRRGVVATLLGAAAIGAVIAIAGGAVPR